MMRRVFRVQAVWDADAEVFYSRSDIEGLHIEAADLEEFEAIMIDVAPELIIANHWTAREIADHSFKDLIPAILWQHPDMGTATA